MAFRMNLFRTPRHRKYEYIPRYFNPEKEELDARLKRAEIMAEDSIDGMKTRIATQMKRGGNTKAYASERKKAVMRSNLLLLAIIIVLLFVAFLAINIYLPNFIENFE